jgi:NIPSNAP
MFYELATLTLRLGTTPQAAKAVEAYARSADAGGRLLGCWYADIGDLNEVLVLRGFDDEAALNAERRRTLLAADPFGCAEFLTRLELHGYAPFPWLPPVEPAALGPIYEIRSYELKTGGLQPTLAAWEKALPARSGVSPCTIAMYALDGAPRITHIWPSATLNERSASRAEAVRQGVWPPVGGPAWLMPAMKSGIYLPTAVSPLQ